MSRSPPEGPGDAELHAMDKLLNALRVVAREEDAAAAACPADQVPEISASLRAQIAAEAVRQLSRVPTVGVIPAQSDSAALSPVAGDQLRGRRDRRVSQRSRRMAWSLGTAALAAAAALLLWIRAPTAPAGSDGAGALPDYAVVASGGLADTRGGGQPSGSDDATATTAAPVRLNGSSELRVIGRPESAVVGPVAARAFVVRDGVATEVVPTVQIAATGAVELRLRGAQLNGGLSAAGGTLANRSAVSRTLRVVVGRPEAIRAVVPADAVAGAAPGRSRPQEAAERRWLTVPLDLKDQQR